MQRGNVLFITADQWRGDALGAVGHPCLRTPSLDRLAADGVLFRRHYAQAAPCGPGRASLYTGLYMFNHRSVDNGTPLDARFTNIALEARRAGYDPTLFGYTSTAVDPRTVPVGDPRLEDYEGVLPGMTPGVAGKWKPWLAWLKARGFQGEPTPDGVNRQVENYPGAAARGAAYAPPLYGSEESETAFLCEEALKWLALEKSGNGRGWFLHLSIKKPHPPWVAPEPYNAMYDPAEVPAPRRAASPALEARQHPLLAWMIEHHRRPHYTLKRDFREADLDEREIRQMRAVYFGLIGEVDRHIGRIVDRLKMSGEYDDTLIVFTSDHGEHIGDHHLLGKSGYFDEGFHVPLIVRDPRPQGARGRGRQVDAFTEAIDVMPTILDWIGVEVPAQCDGESMLPFLRGEMPSNWRTEAHWEFDFRSVRTLAVESALGLKPDRCGLAVIRDGRYKYVHFTALPPLFFDLADDPHEFHDLSGHPAYLARRLAYAEKMLSWRMNHADRTLANSHVGDGGLRVWRGPRR